MGKDKLVLADGTKITLESSQGMEALDVRVADRAAACALWEKFTGKNLGTIRIEDPRGGVMGEYSGMVLDHVTGRDDADGSVLITFSLRGKTTEEILLERIVALEAGQQTQDDAISDLGQAVSDVAEGGQQ